MYDLLIYAMCVWECDLCVCPCDILLLLSKQDNVAYGRCSIHVKQELVAFQRQNHCLKYFPQSSQALKSLSFAV
jgi:hypothetical protein